MGTRSRTRLGVPRGLAARAALIPVLWALPGAAGATTVYVSPSGRDTDAGTAASPKATIQAGIDAAGASPVVILMDGRYVGAGNTGLVLSNLPQGDITLQAIDGASPIVDCGGQRFLLLAGATAHNLNLKGITVQNGAVSTDGGGALAIFDRSTASITDCVFRSNRATPIMAPAGGGAVAVGPGVSFVRCRFIDNSADVSPHGYSSAGGAVSADTDTFTDCLFEGNRAAGFGGAVLSGGGCVFTRCRFVGNASPTGGALALTAPPDHASDTYVQCLFRANEGTIGAAAYVASGRGGHATFSDCAFIANVVDAANVVSGTVTIAGSSSATLAHCTLAGNAGPATPGAHTGITGYLDAHLTITDSIVRVGAAEQALSVQPSTVVNVSHTDLTGGYAGSGNIDVDPQFANPAGGDYRLLPTSPCIDAGSIVAAGELDLDGNPRAFGSAPDMGAYELFCKDISDGFAITRGAWTYNRATASYTQPLTVANTGADVTTPLYLVLAGVTGGAVQSPAGVTRNTNPAGRPYGVLSATGLPHGGTASFTVTLRATSGAISFTPLIYTGSGRP